MSKLANLKQEVLKWNLESDRQLAKALEASTEQMYTGINEVITSLKEIEKNTEDCYIQLRHAVNWVTSLSYAKFIENNIQPSSPDTSAKSSAAPPPVAAKTPEQIIAKYRKAIEIAINDLNLKDLKPDEGMTQVEGEAAEGQTMAMGGTYVTPQLRKKLPFLIGSKEFYSTQYIGIEVSPSPGLTEESLNKLKAEEKEKNAAGSPTSKPADAGSSLITASSVVIGSTEEAKGDLNAAVKQSTSPPANAASGAKKYDASSYLDSYNTGGSKPFGLEGADEDEVLPQFNKNEPDKIPQPPPLDIPQPPPLDIPQPPPMDIPQPPPMLDIPQPPPMDIPQPPPFDIPQPPPFDDIPQPPPLDIPQPPPMDAPQPPQPAAKTKSALFAEEEEVGAAFSSIMEKKAVSEPAKVDYKQKMSKLFGNEDDDDSFKPKKKPEDLISIYKSKSSTQPLFGDPDEGKPKEEKKAEVTNSKSNEATKRLSKFLDDNDDDDTFSGFNVKKPTGKKDLFGDDD